MVPINHSVDNVDLCNLDSNVPEHQDMDVGRKQTRKQLSDSCSNKQYASAISKPPCETTSGDSESASGRQASSRHRYAGRNRSSFSTEKFHGRPWRDERYRYKVDNSRPKLPSGTHVEEPAQSLGASDDVINGETAVSKPLTEMTHYSSGDYGAELSKPVVPSGREQNGGRRSGNYYARSRNRYSGSYRKYDDGLVLHPRRYKDRETNRQPRSEKATADAFSDDAGYDFDEDSSDSRHDRATRSSAVVPGNKESKSQYSGRPQRRRNNGYRSYQNTADRLTSTAAANSTVPTAAPNPERYQSKFNDTEDNVEMKFRTSSHRPRKHWNRKVSDNGSRLSVGRDEDSQKTTDALSHLSVEASKGDDVQRERGTVEVTKDDRFTSAEQRSFKQVDVRQTNAERWSQGAGSRQRRNYHSRRLYTYFAREPASRDDQQCPQDRADASSSCAEKEPHRKNSGSRYSAGRNFRRESRPSTNKLRYSNETVRVNTQTEVPSTSPQQPPGFCVQGRPTAATAQPPTS